MKIELKNIHFSERLSQESNAFDANLYIDDIKAGTASNQGHGGPTIYRAFDEKGKTLISDAEKYCKALPAEKFSSDGKDYSIEMNLEAYIDKLFDNYLLEKDQKKFQKKIDNSMEKGIVVGIPNDSFEVWGFKTPMANIVVHPDGPALLKKVLIKDVIPRLTDGRIVMNTNIPLEILKESGLKEGQYAIRPISKVQIESDQKKSVGRKM